MERIPQTQNFRINFLECLPSLHRIVLGNGGIALTFQGNLLACLGTLRRRASSTNDERTW
jgi:hypothetical protein